MTAFPSPAFRAAHNIGQEEGGIMGNGCFEIEDLQTDIAPAHSSGSVVIEIIFVIYFLNEPIG
jgi:hypothetical protein